MVLFEVIYLVRSFVHDLLLQAGCYSYLYFCLIHLIVCCCNLLLPVFDTLVNCFCQVWSSMLILPYIACFCTVCRVL